MRRYPILKIKTFLVASLLVTGGCSSDDRPEQEDVKLSLIENEEFESILSVELIFDEVIEREFLVRYRSPRGSEILEKSVSYLRNEQGNWARLTHGTTEGRDNINPGKEVPGLPPDESGAD